MDILKEHIDSYKKQHPNAENPMNFLHSFGEKKVLDMLKNANGRMLKVERENGVLDGGKLTYVNQ